MIIIDDYLKDDSSLEELSSINLYDSCLTNNHFSHMFWDGWWKKPVNTVKKKVIKQIWQDKLPADQSEILGFEYWTKYYSVNDDLNPHFDEDFFYYETTKIFCGADLGCIYYGPITNCTSGSLVIYDFIAKDGQENLLEKESMQEIVKVSKIVSKIEAIPNRLVIFNSGHILHSVEQIKSGNRYMLAINIWLKNNSPLGYLENKYYKEP